MSEEQQEEKAEQQSHEEDPEVVIVEEAPREKPKHKESPAGKPPRESPGTEVVVVEEAPEDEPVGELQESKREPEKVPAIPPEEFGMEESTPEEPAPTQPPAPIDDENPEIVIMEKEEDKGEETAQEGGEKKDDEPIKCPICGSVNQTGSTQCFLCQTHLSRGEGGKIQVKSPKLPGDILTMVDIEDPVTRRKLEELTLIPGVSRVKALYLFQSGIMSMEEFIEKAFHGERMSKNFSRSVTNKLLMESIKDGQEAEEVKLICPSCNAPNKADATNCGVCGYEIDADLQAVNLEDVTKKLNVTVDEVFGDLMESNDFKALPEDLKAQMAMAMESDDYDDMRDVTAEMELLDLKDMEAPEGPAKEPAPESEGSAFEEPDKTPDEEKEGFAFEKTIEEKAVEPKVAAEPEAATEPEGRVEPEEIAEPSEEPEAPAAEPEPVVTMEEREAEAPAEATEPEVPDGKTPVQAEPEAPAKEETVEAEPEKAEASPEELERKKAEHAKKVAERKQKIKDTLLEKMDQWRKAGYAVDDLEQYLDDLNEFKAKAKEALKKGKTVKEKYKKQLEMWREKGFDVIELEPLLETDIVAFKEKAKDIVKGQK